MGSTQPGLDKAALRRQVRADLASLDPTWMVNAARVALSWLAPEITHGTVLAYAPLPGEVPLAPVLVALATEGRLVLPRVQGAELRLHRVEHLDELERGAMGISEPRPDHPSVAPAHIDTVIVPGLAFGRDGTRLGRGKGYYDRLLPHLRARRLALCFSRQLFETVPTEPHDQRVSVIVTEEGRWPVG